MNKLVWDCYVAFIVSVIIMIIMLLFVAGMSGCTVNITLAHTEGTTHDLVDTAQTASPDVSPELTIPASLL